MVQQAITLQEVPLPHTGPNPPHRLSPAGKAGSKSVTYNPQALLAAVCRHAPQFKGRQQHDAHELLRLLLDGLQVGWQHPLPPLLPPPTSRPTGAELHECRVVHAARMPGPLMQAPD